MGPEHPCEQPESLMPQRFSPAHGDTPGQRDHRVRPLESSAETPLPPHRIAIANGTYIFRAPRPIRSTDNTPGTAEFVPTIPREASCCSSIVATPAADWPDI
ncbi:hypothetical protein GCM10027089_57220 [Nocardia thraciensis]